MTANSPNGWCCFAALREEHDTYEGGLALGPPVRAAQTLVVVVGSLLIEEAV